MRYYLYKFECDSVTDSSASGFAVFTKNEKVALLAKLKREYEDGGTIYVESINEEIDCDDSDDLFNYIKFETISQTQYNVLKGLFKEGFGELGPVDIDDLYDEDDEDEEERCCDECGAELEDYEHDICDACEEEKNEREENRVDYFDTISDISNFISTEYNLINGGPLGGGVMASYDWRPTTTTRIKVTIPDYVGDESEKIEAVIFSNNKRIMSKTFYVSSEDYDSDGLKRDIKHTIDNFLSKAKKY